MSDHSDVERQLVAFGVTLEHETGEPITRERKLANPESNWPGRRLVAAAVAVLLVLGTGVVLLIRAPDSDRVADRDPAVSLASTPSGDRTTVDTEPGASELVVTNRYRSSTSLVQVFPSPDGALYLDQDGCVLVTAEDLSRSCPQEELSVEFAHWAPDGSFAVFDEPAFRFNTDSDIHVVFVDRAEGKLQTRFENLTGESTGDDANIDLLPLVVDDEIRFLRFRAPGPNLEMVTISLDGTVLSSAPETLPLADLVTLEAVLVDNRHVVIGRISNSDRTQLVTLDGDGTTIAYPVAGESSRVLWGSTGAAATMSLDAGSDPLVGRIRTFDGTSYTATGLEVTLGDGNTGPTALAFSPDGNQIVAAYPANGTSSSILRVWDTTTGTTTDIGIVEIFAATKIQWTPGDQLIIFGRNDIVEIQLASR